MAETINTNRTENTKVAHCVGIPNTSQTTLTGLKLKRELKIYLLILIRWYSYFKVSDERVIKAKQAATRSRTSRSGERTSLFRTGFIVENFITRDNFQKYSQI